MTRPSRLADSVRARSNDARIERQWAALEQAGLPGPAGAGAGGSRVRVAIATSLAGAALAVGALLWVGSGDRASSLPVGALVESAQAPVAVQLEDGSRVELSPRAQLRLVKNGKREVLLELRAGKARFAVAHDRSRPFKIDAGGAEIRVVGTRFELTRSQQAGGEQLSVSVSEGVVEVRRSGESEVQRLRAGEHWGAFLPVAKPSATASAGKPASQLNGSDARLEPAAEAPPEAPSEPDNAGEPELDPSEAEAVAASASEPSNGPRAAAMRERAAARVFERANLARRAGRVRDAADAYAELLARFPRDRRAGLSAFELGRIRMDALHDPASAIEALERAAAAGDDASFHEDALARMVVAYDAEGRTAACRKARDRYLARYPNGVHAHVLAARCQ
jgi:transmembrane sensor